MCGRFQLQASADAIVASHPNASWRSGHAERYYPRQQLRPTNHAPVVVAKRQRPSSAPSTTDAEIVIMKWGMTSAWSTQQHRPPLINARRETLLRLPTFRKALKSKDGSRRCAVPTTGFYEWQKSPGPGKPTLTPYLVKKTHNAKGDSGEVDLENVSYMAGLYDQVGESSTDDELCFVVITTEACKQFEWLHDRQPVFLSSGKDIDAWLSIGITPENAVAELRTENGFSWTRMTKDLSEAAKGKVMIQRGLDSFFGKKASGMKESKKRQETQKLPGGGMGETTKESSKVIGGIKKNRKGLSKEGRTKQKTLSSFFSSGSKE